MKNITKYRKEKKYCKCGCGNLVKCKGYEYTSGHNPKIHFKKENKIRNTGRTRFQKGHKETKKIKEKRRISMLGNKNCVGREPWNKGMAGEYIVLSTRGENHWNWGGGITSPIELLRLKSKWKIWRELVFLRDNFICQNSNCSYCKNKRGGIELHPHHIKPTKLFPELVFDINNGITYCKDFHIKGGLHKGIKIKNG